MANYSCPASWVLSGSTCTQAASVSYSCPSGWTQSGTSCTQNSTYATSTQSCPSGGTISNLSFTCHTVFWWLQVSGTWKLFYDSSDCGSIASDISCTQTSSQTSGQTYVNAPNFDPSYYTTQTDTYACSAPNSDTSGAQSSFSRVGCSGSSCSLHPAVAQGIPFAAGSNYNGATCTINGSQAATVNYTCASGGSSSGPTCSQAAGVSYSCPNGGTLNGTACLTSATNAAYVAYSCPKGYSQQGAICVQSLTNAAQVTYSCPSGSQLSGSTCLATTVQAAGVSYSCAAGATLQGTSCVSASSVAATPVYSCPQGETLSGTTCSSTASSAASLSYSCPPGATVSGSSCITTSTQPANTTYSCASGFALVGATCQADQTQAASVSYACLAGYTYANGTCSETLTQAALPVLQCPSGYTLAGSTCSETLSQVATTNYTCAAGWNLSGSTCSSTILATPSGYSCPVSYTLAGSSCLDTVTTAAAATYGCPQGGTLSGTNCQSFATPSSGNNAGCSAPVDSCTDSSPTTRVVNGVSVTQPCWAWNRTYTCTNVTQGNTSCTQLQSNADCQLTSTQCLDSPASTSGCQVENQVYTCSVPGTASTAPQYVCQSGIYCIDGSCQQVQANPSQDFTKAVAALSTIGTVQNELDPNNITLFQGTADGCHKPLFGIENCCAGGPGIPLIGTCSADEEALASDFNKGITHYVGTFCSSSILSVCISEHETFCVFQSKLGRLIQEQGRAQLNLDFGTAQNPNCAGLTPQQFAQLDLSKMDFSAVMNDLTSDVTIPHETSTLSTMQQKIQAYYSNNTGS